MYRFNVEDGGQGREQAMGYQGQPKPLAKGGNIYDEQESEQERQRKESPCPSDHIGIKVLHTLLAKDIHQGAEECCQECEKDPHHPEKEGTAVLNPFHGKFIIRKNHFPW